MDDLGAGQSTLRRPRDLPIDEVTIDRVFVATSTVTRRGVASYGASSPSPSAAASPWSPRASNARPSWMRAASPAATVPGGSCSHAPPRRRPGRAQDPCTPPAQQHFRLHQRCDPWVRSATPRGTCEPSQPLRWMKSAVMSAPQGAPRPGPTSPCTSNSTPSRVAALRSTRDQARANGGHVTRHSRQARTRWRPLRLRGPPSAAE